MLLVLLEFCLICFSTNSLCASRIWNTRPDCFPNASSVVGILSYLVFNEFPSCDPYLCEPYINSFDQMLMCFVPFDFQGSITQGEQYSSWDHFYLSYIMVSTVQEFWRVYTCQWSVLLVWSASLFPHGTNSARPITDYLEQVNLSFKTQLI